MPFSAQSCSALKLIATRYQGVYDFPRTRTLIRKLDGSEHPLRPLPTFPTRTGSRRNKDNVRLRVIAPVLTRADELRAAQDRPSIRAHVTPHTFRRTYITYMIAAGYDIPYVQAQVGHDDPGVTLSIYAQVMRRADREQLKDEIRALFGLSSNA